MLHKTTETTTDAAPAVGEPSTPLPCSASLSRVEHPPCLAPFPALIAPAHTRWCSSCPQIASDSALQYAIRCRSMLVLLATGLQHSHACWLLHANTVNCHQQCTARSGHTSGLVGPAGSASGQKLLFRWYTVCFQVLLYLRWAAFAQPAAVWGYRGGAHTRFRLWIVARAVKLRGEGWLRGAGVARRWRHLLLLLPMGLLLLLLVVLVHTK